MNKTMRAKEKNKLLASGTEKVCAEMLTLVAKIYTCWVELLSFHCILLFFSLPITFDVSLRRLVLSFSLFSFWAFRFSFSALLFLSVLCALWEEVKFYDIFPVMTTTTMATVYASSGRVFPFTFFRSASRCTSDDLCVFILMSFCRMQITYRIVDNKNYFNIILHHNAHCWCCLEIFKTSLFIVRCETWAFEVSANMRKHSWAEKTVDETHKLIRFSQVEPIDRKRFSRKLTTPNR